MRRGLVISLVLHAAILAAALVVLPNPNKFDVRPQDAIQVDISKIGDVSKRMAMTKEAPKPKEKPAPKKTEVVKKTEPAPKVAEVEKKAAPEPKPEPEPKKEEPKPLDAQPLKDLIKDTVSETPEPKKKEEPKQQEAKKVEEKPKEKPKKPEKKKPKLNPDEIAAFLNKVDDEKTAPEQPADNAAEPVQGEQNTQGNDDQMSADIVDALVQKLKECWTVPPGAREAKIVVSVHFLLNADGSVNGIPEVVNPSSDPLFDSTARSAVAAVLECQAYSFLPQDRYDLWKDNTINFNPNMMFDS